MDTFVLLPFFLLGRISTDVHSRSDANTWRYGPEFTYDVFVNVTRLSDSSPISMRGFQLTTTLICRPRDSYLNCRFGRVWTTTYRDGAPSESRHGFRGWQSHEPFQISFDHRGVSLLTVSRRTGDWNADIIRAIASQFNVGADLTNFTDDGERAVRESFYMGECESRVNVSRTGRSSARLPWKSSFEILPWHGIPKFKDEVLKISKKRDLGRCTSKKDYVFADEAYDPRITSSYHKFMISDMTFQAYTINAINISIMGGNVLLSEKIAVYLMTVLPADGPLQSVSNPTTINVDVKRSVSLTVNNKLAD